MNPTAETRENTAALLPMEQYDKVVVAFSGGKDSLACILRLLDMGVARDKIVLWHHAVDGEPGQVGLMDWPCTEGYVRAVAKALGLEIRFSWKNRGFEGEMLRQNALTAPTTLETMDGSRITTGGTTGKEATRMMFPQVSPDLTVRWCSAYLKIDVAAKVFTNDPFFKTGKFVILTGERREESPGRARYAEVEEHKASTANRTVHQWRAVIDFTEQQVWDLIAKHHIAPHPAYQLGFGRVSCMPCIFGKADQWAAVKELDAARFEKIAKFEEQFGKTIQRTESVRVMAAKGTSFVLARAEIRELAMTHGEFAAPVIVNEWTMPAGAFRRTGGPV